MTGADVLAQASTDTSSAAATVFGLLVLVGGFSIVALTRRGRRSLLPLVAVLLGLAIGWSTLVTVGQSASIVQQLVSPITILGLFIAALLVAGGLGALREGITLPEVEGTDPDVPSSAPRRTPDDG